MTPLNPEQRAWIERLVARVDGVSASNAAQRLVPRIEASLAAYSGLPAFVPMSVQRALLRALLGLIEMSDPPIGMIRRRIAALPKPVLSHLEHRASRIAPQVIGTALPAGGLHEWSSNAPPAELLMLLHACSLEGRVFVAGRWRPGGKRSRGRSEPVLLGAARGADAKRGTAQDAPRPILGDGRPRQGNSVRLISWLAVDWLLAVDQEPQPGRSDQAPFGALVHHVFGWLGLPDATGALRRYWARVPRRKPAP